jgi:hypothetical protein
VEEQIGHLRAQLLRSEQDNELMRIKLEQETAEREKAQKQVRNTWLPGQLFLGLCCAATCIRPYSAQACMMVTQQCLCCGVLSRLRSQRRSCLSSRRRTLCRARTTGVRHGALGGLHGHHRWQVCAAPCLPHARMHVFLITPVKSQQVRGACLPAGSLLHCCACSGCGHLQSVDALLTCVPVCWAYCRRIQPQAPPASTEHTGGRRQCHADVIHQRRGRC